VLAICEGIERIIGIETVEGEARAEVGSDMNRPGTEMVIIVAIGLTVSVLIMTGNVTDTGMSNGVGDILYFCFLLSYQNALFFTPFFNTDSGSPVLKRPSHSRSRSPRRAPHEGIPSKPRDGRAACSGSP
jgi:hypothetical protein